MNPPLTSEERHMFSEIMTQMRCNHEELNLSIARMDDKLERHVMQEDGQYAKVQSQLSELKGDVKVLKSRWGVLASIAGMVGAAAMAFANKVFF
jgi:hypothetical protein